MNLKTVLEIEQRVGGMSHYDTVAINATELYELCEVARKALMAPQPEAAPTRFRAVGYVTNDGCVKWEPGYDPQELNPGQLLYVSHLPQLRHSQEGK